MRKRHELKAGLLTGVFILLLSLPGISNHAAVMPQDEATKQYQAAYEQILNENWQPAIRQLDAFIQTYPNSGWTDDARFWQCYAREKLSTSLEEVYACYEQFLKDYSDSKWADDARSNMIRIGQELVRTGHPTYKARIQALQQSDNEEIVLSALMALQNIGDQESMQAMLDLYNSNQPAKVKEKIIFLLGQSDATGARQKLEDIARQDTSAKMRQDAIFWLGQSAQSQQDVQFLAKIASSDPDQKVRDRAVFSLGQAPEELGKPILRQMAQDSQDPKVREQAVFWLGQGSHDRNTIRFLEQVAGNDPDPAVREKAVFAISQAARDLSQPALMNLVKRSTDPKVREMAVFWLGQGADSDQTLNLLETIARSDTSRAVREKAVFALGQAPDNKGTEALMRLAKSSKDPKVQEQAVFWLGRSGSSDDILNFLTQLAMQGDNTDLRKPALFALSQVPEGRGIPALMKIARTAASPEIRANAVFWLGQSAGNGRQKDILNLLQEVIQKDQDPDVQEKAIFALGQMPEGAGVPVLIDLATNSKKVNVRKKAIFWLGQSNDPRAREALAKIVQGEG